MAAASPQVDGRLSLARSRTGSLSAAKILSLFVFGAVVVSFFDGFHTHSGTTLYATTIGWQMAWWTPLIFGASVGLGGPAFAITYERLGGTRVPPAWPALCAAFVAFGTLYYFSGYYHGPNTTKLLVLGAAAVGLWAALDRSWQGAVCLIGTAFTGPLVEIVLTHVDAFKHLQPDFLGIPCWLPALYACSAPVIGHGTRRFLGAGH